MQLYSSVNAILQHFGHEIQEKAGHGSLAWHECVQLHYLKLEPAGRFNNIELARSIQEYG